MQTLYDRLRKKLSREPLPSEAQREQARDRQDGLDHDPGPARAISAGLRWLCRAQDQSQTEDGGVARHYSLIDGWASSYPETTGYIIPTLIEQSEALRDPELLERARRMLDWLAEIQLFDGAFQGGLVDSDPRVPVTFNTGQILLGLAAGAQKFGEPYSHAMRRAANWLTDPQDADGCWRAFPTPFAGPGEKVYETHVAWGLLEAANVDGSAKFARAALRNIRWALTKQHPNGWFDNCCLNDCVRPLTHTLGYVLRGVVEGWRYSGDPELLAAARRTADGILSAQREDGSLSGRLDRNWRGRVDWVCLTGVAQISSCWLLLFARTGETNYREAAQRANRYVRRTLRLDVSDDERGAVKGSFPVDGDYGKYQYLNWACKFMIDANHLERTLSNAPCVPRALRALSDHVTR